VANQNLIPETITSDNIAKLRDLNFSIRNLVGHCAVHLSVVNSRNMSPK